MAVRPTPRPRVRRSAPSGLVIAPTPLRCGPVWEVWPARLGDRDVVVKRARRPSEATVALLTAEATVLASLPPARTVRPIVLVAPRRSRHHGLVSEAVPGGSLRAVLGAEGRLDARAATGVLVDLARTLAVVHAAGWVHGRVDLDHVLVGADRRAVLGGFGHARGDLGSRAATAARATDLGQLARLGRELLGGDGAGQDGATSPEPPEVPPGLASVLARIEDPDPARRPDAATVVELLRRFAPTPAALPRPGDRAVADHASLPHPGLRSAAPTHRSPTGRAAPGQSSRADTTPPAPDTPPGGDASEPVGPAPPSHGATPATRVPRPSVRRRTGTQRPGAPGQGHGGGRVGARALAAALALAGIALIGTGVHRIGRSGPDDTAADPAAVEHPPPCAEVGAPQPPPDAVTAQVDPDARGCTVPVHWSPSSGELTVATPEGVRRFRLGSPGDRLVLGDWDCDGRATPLLVRPGAPVAYRFDAWPTDDVPVHPTEVTLPPADAGTDPTPPRCD